MNSSPQRRRRAGVFGLLLIISMMAVACSAAATTTASSTKPNRATTEPEPTVASEPSAAQPSSVPNSAENSADVGAAVTPPTAATTETPVEPTPHPIAAANTELPPAPIGFDDLFANQRTGPQPVSIEIDNINVADAGIIPVGVNDDLTFEVPPADQVGWYEFGAAPGEAGSAVLAAHIAYNGVDGVFRYLKDVEIGSVVIVTFDDDSRKRYRIEEVTEYVKEELPDSLFARDGDEQLALITCGGTFNYQLDSYESNTVAIAVPV